jgi:hypothetical protein
MFLVFSAWGCAIHGPNQNSKMTGQRVSLATQGLMKFVTVTHGQQQIVVHLKPRAAMQLFSMGTRVAFNEHAVLENVKFHPFLGDSSEAGYVSTLNKPGDLRLGATRMGKYLGDLNITDQTPWVTLTFSGLSSASALNLKLVGTQIRSSNI